MERMLLDRLPDGRELYLMFEGDRVAVVEKVPERVNRAIMQEAHEEVREYRPGAMVGNTQRHIQPAAAIPLWLKNKWAREMGPRQHDPQEKKKFEQAKLNSNEFSKFRTGGGRL